MNNPDSNGVAIVGMAGRFPQAPNIRAFWDNLKKGVEAIRVFSEDERKSAGLKARGVLDGADKFDAAFFGIDPKEAEILDPQHRVFLECAWEAMEDAGYDASREERPIGVFAGSSMNTYLLANIASNPDLMETVGGYKLMLANDKDYLPTRVSYKLNLRGPSLSVQTGSSSSLVAVCVACQHLLQFQCDMALAGGVSILSPDGNLHQSNEVVSPDGHCRPFDAKAEGTVVGEGVGVVVLKRLEDAVADGDSIYAVIKGFATNNNGSAKGGFSAASEEGQAEVVAWAQALAGVSPDSISYIVTHGTGAGLSDAVEFGGLTKAFREGTERKRFCALTSPKGNIGHLDAAAGIAGLINAALALRHRQIPPSLNFEKPNPKIDLLNSPFFVNAKLADWKGEGTRRRAGVSAFGVGGTNAHVVLEEAPGQPSAQSARPHQLLTLSARSEPALRALGARLANYLRVEPGCNLADLAYTLQVGRQAFDYRQAMVCLSAEEAIKHLENLPSGSVLANSANGVAFVFPANAPENIGLLRQLYDVEAVFREHADICCRILKQELGREFSLFGPVETTTSFIISYALAKQWMSWGITPQALISDGAGECVAACLAGVLSLKEALAVACGRTSWSDLHLKEPRIRHASLNDGQSKIHSESLGVLARERLILVECGLGEVLGSRLREHPACGTHLILPSVSGAPGLLLPTLGELWKAGIVIDWKRVYGDEKRLRISLPTYPFEHQRFWIEPGGKLGAPKVEKQPGSIPNGHISPSRGASSGQQAQLQPVAVLPLTESQKEIWFASQMSQEASASFNQSAILEMRGPLDVNALQRAIERVVERHVSLRTVFDSSGQEQRVLPITSAKLEFEDLVDNPLEQAAKLEQMYTQEAQGPFNLVRGPLIRFRLVKLAPEHHQFLFTAHHLVCDGASVGILVQEIAKAYSAPDAELPPVLAYGEYVSELQSDAHQARRAEDETYWLQQFQVLPPSLNLSGGLRKEALDGGAVRLTLNPGFTQKVKQLAGATGGTLFTTMLGTFAGLLHGLTRNDRLVVGVPTALRHHLPGVSLVGHCVNFLPLVFSIDGQSTAQQHLQKVKGVFLEAYEHLHFPYGSLLQSLNLSRNQTGQELVTVTFNFQRETTHTLFKNLQVKPIPNPKLFSNFELSMDVGERGGELNVEMRYNASLFERETVSGWLAAFEALLGRMVEDRLIQISTLTAGIKPVEVISSRVSTKTAVSGAGAARPEFVPPQTATEEALAELWKGLIGAPKIGIHDNFFELGGHSVLVTQLVTRIRKAFQLDVSIRTAFEHPTIAEQARVLEAMLMQEIEGLSDNEAQAMAEAGPVRVQEHP